MDPVHEHLSVPFLTVDFLLVFLKEFALNEIEVSGLPVELINAFFDDVLVAFVLTVVVFPVFVRDDIVIFDLVQSEFFEFLGKEG